MNSTNILFHEEEFSFCWQIDNLQYSSLSKGMCVNSPKFTLMTFFSSTWHLKFYPNGCKNSAKGHSSCYLHREFDDFGDVEITFDLSINSVSKNLTHSFPARGQSWGFRNFLPSFSNSGSVVIKCGMRMCPIKPARILDYHLLPFDTRDLALWEGMFNPIHRSVRQMMHDTFSFPRKCFARSLFLAEENIIVWPISYSIIKENQTELVIPVQSLNKNSNVIIKLQKIVDVDDQKVLQVELALANIDTMADSVLLFCKMSVVDSGIEIISKTEEKHIFKKDSGNQLWRLEQSFDVSVLQQKLSVSFTKQFYLCFELKCSLGEVCSEIVWETNYIQDSLDRNKSLETESVSCQLLRLYKENNFCDTILRVKNKSYDVHKTVLCAMSSVFSSMFAGDLMKGEPYTIALHDVDEEIINQLIYFLYTGVLESLEFSTATKLFVAAHKYQIISLLKKCRDFIINNMDLENIFEILILIDDHPDIILKKSVVSFVSFHRSTLLLFEAWKKFEKENAALAIEILRDMCLQLPESDLKPTSFLGLI